MKLSQLPPRSTVAVDTESSALRWEPPDRARLSVISVAFRDPITQVLCSQAIPFDQGAFDHQLPIGPKPLASSHTKRVNKWPDWAKDEQIPNLGPSQLSPLLNLLATHNLVFHNAKHDLHALRVGLRDGTAGLDLRESVVWDTMLAQAVIEPQFPIGLKETAERHFIADGGEADEKEAMKPWLGPQTDARYDLVPWKVIRPYAIKDAELTLLLWEMQIDRMNYDQHRFMEFDLRFMQVLYRMEQRGIGFDVETAKESARLLAEAKKRVASELPFKATGPGARKYFFEDLGHHIYKDKMTSTGQPQIDEEVVTRLVTEGIPYSAEFQIHEGLKSALAKWYTPWPASTGEDGRLRTNHNQSSTVGGRLSVNQVQLHAIPHNYQLPKLDGLVPVRQLFKPRPNYVLWEVDASQVEIRVGCAIAGCRGLLEGFRAGLDAHSAATTQMFGIEPDHPSWDEMRQVAKRINLSIQYGAGAPKIREQILKFTGRDYTLKQVREWVDTWKETYPEMVRAMERERAHMEEFNCVRLPNGRTRYFRDWELRAPYKAFNAKAQFMVARVMAEVMVDWEALHPGTLLLQIHDSLVLELPDWCDEQMVAVAQDLIVRKFESFCARSWRKGEPRTVVPFKADAKRFGA